MYELHDQCVLLLDASFVFCVECHMYLDVYTCICISSDDVSV